LIRATDPIHQKVQAGHMNAREADTAEKSQDHCQDKAVGERGKREGRDRPEQCARDI
jgi:hypothetical protein